MEWEYSEFNLDELGFLGRGKSKHRPRNDSSLYGGKYPFIQTGDVRAANLYLNCFEQTYNDKGLAQSKLWDRETLIITIAANIAETAVLKIDACFPDSIVGFIPNEDLVDVYFVKYYIDYIKLEMQSISQGTTQDNLSLDKLRTFKFKVPKDRGIVSKISSTLLNYDNLIENNNRRIAILEDMAQSLYREWFVNFRYPNHQDNLDADGKPKLIDSPLGLIPVGWKIKCLKNIGFINTGKTPSKDKEENYSSNDVPFIKTPDMHGGMFVIKTREMLSTLGADSQKSKYIPSWAICVSCIGTAGIVALSSQKSQTNQQINTLVPEVKAHTEFMYFTLKSLKKTIENYGATGATMTNLSKGKFESLEIVFPEDSLLDEFHQLTNPMFKQIQILARKNENLKQQRDMLLPKLISGQIEL